MRMHNPPHPSAVISDTLGDVTREQLASTLGLTLGETDELLHGKRDITPEIAQRLVILYPIQSAELWLRLQRQRDEWLSGLA